MSWPVLCVSCEMGDHDRHERDWGIRMGVIGGSYCPCSGPHECAGNGDLIKAAIAKLTTRAPTQPEPAAAAVLSDREGKPNE